MNYYPYYNFIPNSMPTGLSNSPGIFSRIFRGGINWGSIINNTQKTLNIINQTIPVVKQVTPVVKNAKTMFKVLNEFKKDDEKVIYNKTNNSTSNNVESVEETININQTTPEIGPTFFA